MDALLTAPLIVRRLRIDGGVQSLSRARSVKRHIQTHRQWRRILAHSDVAASITHSFSLAPRCPPLQASRRRRSVWCWLPCDISEVKLVRQETHVQTASCGLQSAGSSAQWAQLCAVI